LPVRFHLMKDQNFLGCESISGAIISVMEYCKLSDILPDSAFSASCTSSNLVYDLTFWLSCMLAAFCPLRRLTSLVIQGWLCLVVAIFDGTSESITSSSFDLTDPHIASIELSVENLAWNCTLNTTISFFTASRSAFFQGWIFLLTGFCLLALISLMTRTISWSTKPGSGPQRHTSDGRLV